MSSNLAYLPPPPVLTSSGQEWQFQIRLLTSTPQVLDISHVLLRSSCQDLAYLPPPPVLTSSGQEWQFQIW